MNIAAAGALIEAKDFSTKRRKTLAKKGFAKPDGSYPIEDEQDVHNAVSDFHRASGSPSDKAHIRTRAKALGMGDPFSNVKAGGPGSGRKPESELPDSNKWRELPDSNNWRELPDSNNWREIPEPMRAGGPGSGRHPGGGSGEKPKWGADTPNKGRLNSFHKKLTDAGFKYTHSYAHDKNSTAHQYSLPYYKRVGTIVENHTKPSHQMHYV